MNTNIRPNQVVEIPLARRFLVSFLDLFSYEHCMFGFLEVDVTAARQFMEAYKERTGERLSFTGYLAYCLARAVDENKSVQAYRKGRKQLVMFDDVDVGLMVEHQIGETRVPISHVIRCANQKTFMEIHQEIRAIQAGPAPRRKDVPSWVRFWQRLPEPLARLFNALVRMAMRRDPAGTWVAMAGTVGITAVGMFGNSAGWGLAPDGYTLWLIVGGIGRKPAAVEDRIELREILSLTVAFNHDVIDGAPAARFTQRLVKLIESGYGLCEADNY